MAGAYWPGTMFTINGMVLDPANTVVFGDDDAEQQSGPRALETRLRGAEVASRWRGKAASAGGDAESASLIPSCHARSVLLMSHMMMMAAMADHPASWRTAVITLSVAPV